MKKVFVASLPLLFASICACSVEEQTPKVSPESVRFSSHFMDYSNTNILSNNAMRYSKTRSSENGMDLVNQDTDEFDIYIDYPQDTEEEIKNLTQCVASAADIVSLYNHTAAKFYSNPVNNTPYKITVSAAKARESLKPTLAEAKEYLKAQGITEADINQMIKEFHGDELDLIPTVIFLVNQEYDRCQQIAMQKQQKSFDLLSFLATEAHAQGKETPELSIANNDDNNTDTGFKINSKELFEVAFDCGLEAIGFDIFWSVGSSASQKWTLSAIKKVFKSVVGKALGPVGTSIMVASFGYCLYKNRREYTCVYSVRIPQSKYDELYYNIKHP